VWSNRVVTVKFGIHGKTIYELHLMDLTRTYTYGQSVTNQPAFRTSVSILWVCSKAVTKSLRVTFGITSIDNTTSDRSNHDSNVG